MYALDEQTVLRRYCRRFPDEEVAKNQYVRASGFPTPSVVDHRGPDLILERVDDWANARRGHWADDVV